MNFDDIQPIFFQECEEGLAVMETSFASIRDGDHDAETINTIFRAVHSIKGGAGAFGHERLQAFTHQYETLLDLVRNAVLALDADLLGLIVAAFDVLADHVAAARDGGTPPLDAPMLDRLEAASSAGATAAAPADDAPAAPAAPIAGSDDGFDAMFDAVSAPAADDGFDAMFATASAPPAADGFDALFDMFEAPAPSAEDGPAEPVAADPDAAWTVRVRPPIGALDNGGEPLLLLRELAFLGATIVSADLADLPLLGAMVPHHAYLGWTVSVPGAVSEDDVRSVFEFMDDGVLTIERDVAQPKPKPQAAEAPAAPAPAPAPVAAKPAAPAAALPPAQPAPPASPAPASPAPASAPPASAQSEPSAPRPAAAAVPQTIRVDLDKLDRLVNLVGELVITQAMVAQRLSQHNLAGIPELTDLEQLTRELQESTMAIRAQPMKTVFSRVPRIIRELELETGKRVRLDVEGEMTEVDKTVVERIGEPLTHLIRNAVDHGLETPAERLAAGKGEEGVVRLSAAHHSGRIVITVADDGRGIDRVRVRAKAIERGIVTPDQPLSDEEIDNLIFAPGFSTAATVSSISGRGVGMDVVRKNVQALGGRIAIQSQLGKGSSFSLSLPLTLAVLDGMIVTVGTQTFVIPLTHIIESLRPSEATVREMGSGTALMNVRGTYVPVHRVAAQLDIEDAETDPSQAVLIVVESENGQAILMVDQIQDQRQVVVKSLEVNYTAIHGLAGATILGDGRVALIIDVDSLISRWRHEGRLAVGQTELAA